MAYEFKDSVRYELDTAYARFAITTDCYRIDITDASTVNASVNVKLILEGGGSVNDIELRKGGYYESPVKIKEIQLTSIAQANEWVEFRETDTNSPPERPDYKRGVSDDAIGSIGQIDSAVVVRSGDSASYVKFTVGTTAIKIADAETTRTGLLAQHLGAADVYFGTDSSVLTSTGIKVVPDGTFDTNNGTEIWAISGSAGNDIRVWKEYK